MSGFQLPVYSLHLCNSHSLHHCLPFLLLSPFNVSLTSGSFHSLFCCFSGRLVCLGWLQSIEDWIQDFKQFLRDAPYSTVLEDMYPEAHVHHGFLQQLQAVTDKAPNTTQNIGDVLMDMSGGVPPSLVIVTGTWSSCKIASCTPSPPPPSTPCENMS